MNRKTITRAIAGSALLAGLAGSAAMINGSRAATSHPSKAVIEPHDFVRHITNPYLPLLPGSVWVYRGIKDGQSQRDIVTVTHRTRTILGMTATEITDVATHNGKLLEKTTDWYAQDREGNVWYLGEDTASYEGGTSITAAPGWPGWTAPNPGSS